NAKDNPTNIAPAGQKRRSWLVDAADNKNIESAGQKGVDSILNETGAIKGAYKPLSLKFADLRSNPLELILFLYELSKMEKDRITRKLTLKEIQRTLTITRDSARTALRFLLKNKLIERVNFKSGKTGWSQYVIKEHM